MCWWFNIFDFFAFAESVCFYVLNCCPAGLRSCTLWFWFYDCTIFFAHLKFYSILQIARIVLRVLMIQCVWYFFFCWICSYMYFWIVVLQGWHVVLCNFDFTILQCVRFCSVCFSFYWRRFVHFYLWVVGCTVGFCWVIVCMFEFSKVQLQSISTTICSIVWFILYWDDSELWGLNYSNRFFVCFWN